MFLHARWQTKAFGDVDTPQIERNKNPPWEPKTFIFRGYDPYVEGLKPSSFMVLGSKGGRPGLLSKQYLYPMDPSTS